MTQKSLPKPLRPLPEKPNQRLDVWLVGADVDGVHVHRAQHAVAAGFEHARFFRKLRAHAAIRRIENDDLAGLRIFQLDQADVRQFHLARVGDGDRHQVMAAVGNAQRLFIAGGNKIRHQKHHGAPRDDAIQIFQRQADVGALSLRLMIQQLAQHPQHVALAFFRRHEFLDAVGENNQADLVVVLDRRERQQGAQFGGDVGLHALEGAELAGGAGIDEQHHGQLALFFEDFHVRVAGARRHVPVDGADVVADHVFAHFGELHAAAFEDRVILAGEHVVHDAARGDLDALDFFEDFFWNHDEVRFNSKKHFPTDKKATNGFKNVKRFHFRSMRNRFDLEV